jgi:hypothetical protein
MRIVRLPWVRALLPVLVASALEAAVGERIRPHVWFLFYPAIFISSWIGDWIA